MRQGPRDTPGGVLTAAIGVVDEPGRWSAMAQPTTRRAQASSSTAGEGWLSPAAPYVLSPTHRRSGVGAL